MKKEIIQLIAKEVQKLMRESQEDLKVVKFSLFKKELDPEDGEITHTRKIRRVFIDEVYKPQIDALYDDNLTDDSTVTKVF